HLILSLYNCREELMANRNLAHIKIDDLEIIGYSVAGEETVVAMPQEMG
ncbi:unnamed protein product, partial [marine sediment metagenome]